MGRVMELFDDNPTTEDALGFGEVAEVLVEVITNARRPLTLGVFGGWGSGKTSLMRMVQKRLSTVDAQVKTVWFNAWKYDRKEAIWNALIQTIFLAMKSDLSSVPETRRKEFLDHLLRVSKELAKYAAKVGTRFVPGNIVREEDVDAVLEALSSGADDRLFEFVNHFEAEFDHLVTEYVGEHGYLVVFIDDLDRCLPENAIEVLEALKLYLDRGDCIFVVGVEPAVIEEAIRARYKDNAVLSPAEYLEKIVQIPFVLPRVRTESALALTGRVIGGQHLNPRQRESLARLVRVGMARNPRRIKRFVNAFVIASSSAGELPPEEQLILAKLLVIRAGFPGFYRQLAQDPRLIEKLWVNEGAPPARGGPQRRIGGEAHWERHGAGALYDPALTRLLERTPEIPTGPERIRRWIRVAGGRSTSSPADDDE